MIDRILALDKYSAYWAPPAVPLLRSNHSSTWWVSFQTTCRAHVPSRQLTHVLCRDTGWQSRFLDPALRHAGACELSSPRPLNSARTPEGSGRGGGPNIAFLTSGTAEISMHVYHPPTSMLQMPSVPVGFQSYTRR